MGAYFSKSNEDGIELQDKRSPYDVVLHVGPHLTSIVNGSSLHNRSGPSIRQPPGWHIDIAPSLRSSIESLEWTGNIVSVIGMYDRGKTFLINKLADQQLPQGKTVRTVGLSFKTYNHNREWHILLDTAGRNTPIELQGCTNIRKAVQEQKVKEFFLNDLVYELADVFVVVVNDLTIFDQDFIERIGVKLNGRKKLIIVHNFKDVSSIAKAEEVFQKQVKDIYPGQVHFDEVNIQSLEKRLIEWFGTQQTKHVFILQDERKEGSDYNQFVYQLLRQWISCDRPDGEPPLKLMETFKRLCGSLLQNYITNVGTVEFDAKQSRLVALPREKEVRSEIQRLSEDLTTGMMTSVRDSIQPTFDIQELKPDNLPDEDNSKNFWLVSVDAPGFNMADLVVKAEARSNLVITGEKKPPVLPGFKQVGHYTSRTTQYGKFDLNINLNSTSSLTANVHDTEFIQPNDPLQGGLLMLKVPQLRSRVLRAPASK